ncbi:MAG: iron(III) transport system permease protein [Streptosporangiaceae bacterium]|jgi:iron(III) transport system permease protein|nr:iron(III) transport system permease protein [Streptosporangiaceae bacterium]
MTSSPALTSDTHQQQAPRPASPRRARRMGRPWALIAACTLIAVILALPLVFLLAEARSSGASTVAQLIFRPLTATLLWNTIRLTVVVTALCAVLGTAAAWCVERTDLPGRRLWAVLVVIPLAIPDFVISFGWASLSTWIHGFRGAVVVMTLAVYPLVYLPVAASLRGADPSQEEVARSLGTGRLRTFARITLGQARGAILGGCLLVAMVMLAEYGAFEIVGYQTFTTEIFTEIKVAFSLPAACALSLVLVLVSLLVLGGEGATRGRGRISRSGALVQRVSPPQRLGRARLPVLAGFVLLSGLALGVPVGASIYWMVDGRPPALTGVSLLDAAGHTALYGAAAAALATLMALPVALLAVRHAGRVRQFLERSTYLVLAMPGVVIALALSYFSERYAAGFGYQTAPLLVLAYAIMFFPLALVGVKASLARAPVSLDEVARSLGQRRLAVLGRVTLRLAGPGLVAAFCLVFLSAVTELTATLILIPTGVQTLATQFWAYETNLSYGQAAPFALVMIAVAAVPSWVLGRFFDRSADSKVGT